MGRLQTDELLVHAGWVRALARRLVADHADAEDLAQETWLRALQSPPRDGRNLMGWLARVARNASHRQWKSDARRARRERSAAESTGNRVPATDELIVEAEFQQRIGERVLGLAEPYRSVILRHYWRGETAGAIAQSSGISAATVRSQLTRARSLLQESLERDDPGGNDALMRSLIVAGAPLSRSVPHPGATPAGANHAPRWTQRISTWLQAIAPMKIPTAILAALVLLVVLGGGWLASNGLEGLIPTDTGTSAEAPRFTGPAAVNEDVAARTSGPGLDGRQSIETLNRAPSAGHLAPPTLPTQTLIGVHVIDSDGDSLGNVILRRAKADPEAGALSDKGGDALLPLTDDELQMWGGEVRSMVFALEGRGYATQFIRATPVRGEATDLGERVLVPAATISGRILDEQGRGIEGLRVLAAPLGQDGQPLLRRSRGPDTGDGVAETVSAAGGHYALTEVAAGTLRLWARTPHDGWASGDPISCAPGHGIDGHDLEIPALDPDDVIELRLLDSSGSPLPSASLQILSEGSPFPRQLAVRPDENGDLRFIAEARVEHDIRVESTRWELQPVLVRGLVPGTPRTTIRLVASRPMSVYVRDRETGEAIEGVWIYTKGEGQMAYDPRSHRDRAPSGKGRPRAMDSPSAEGSDALVLRVPDQEFHVHVKHDGYQQAERGPFDPTRAPEELLIELDRINGLHGTVTLGAEVVAGATVELRRAPGDFVALTSYGFDLRMNSFSEAKTTTDTEGRFVLAAGSAGSYFVVASKKGLALAEHGPIALDPGSPNAPVELTMAQGGAISGRLRFPRGQTVHGQLVAFSRSDGSPRIVRTDKEGRFHCGGLTPGRWLVEHRTTEVERSVSHSVADKSKRPTPWSCEVIDGETTPFDLDLRDRTLATIKGQLIGEGQRFADWTARLQSGPLGTGIAEVPAILVDDGGRFEFTVERGTWYVELTGPVVMGENELQGRRSNWNIWTKLEVEGEAVSLGLSIEPAALTIAAGNRGGPMRTHTKPSNPNPSVTFFSVSVTFEAPPNATLTVPVPVGTGRLERPATLSDSSGKQWDLVRRIEVPPTGLATTVD